VDGSTLEEAENYHLKKILLPSWETQWAQTSLLTRSTINGNNCHLPNTSVSSC